MLGHTIVFLISDIQQDTGGVVRETSKNKDMSLVRGIGQLSSAH